MSGPVNELAKVRATFKVRLCPAWLTEVPPALTVHCEFDTLPLPPGVSAGVRKTNPESLRSDNWFFCG